MFMTDIYREEIKKAERDIRELTRKRSPVELVDAAWLHLSILHEAQVDGTDPNKPAGYVGRRAVVLAFMRAHEPQKAREYAAAYACEATRDSHVRGFMKLYADATEHVAAQAIGHVVSKWRTQKHLPQRGLARLLGLDVAQVCRLEKGRAKHLPLSRMLEIGRILGVPREEVLCEIDVIATLLECSTVQEQAPLTKPPTVTSPMAARRG